MNRFISSILILTTAVLSVSCGFIGRSGSDYGQEYGGGSGSGGEYSGGGGGHGQPYQLEHLGSFVGKHTLPPKVIRITKTVAVKVPVPYPVKVPHGVPYPVHVPKPYPVHIQKLVKVPEPVPVHIPKPVPYPVHVYHENIGKSAAQTSGHFGGGFDFATSHQSQNSAPSAPQHQQQQLPQQHQQSDAHLGSSSNAHYQQENIGYGGQEFSSPSGYGGDSYSGHSQNYAAIPMNDYSSYEQQSYHSGGGNDNGLHQIQAPNLSGHESSISGYGQKELGNQGGYSYESPSASGH